LSDVLEQKTIAYANVEFTSRCNIRCAYCPVSQPDHVSADMPAWMIRDIQDALEQRRTQFVILSGAGETTVLRNWSELCRKFMNGQSHVGIVSNLTRALPADELGILARFNEVTVSLDSADDETLRRIRRGTRLSTVVANIRGIRAKASELGISGPRMVLSCGIYDKNVLLLPRLAQLAIELQFDHVTFWNLVKFPDIEGAENVDLLTSMPKDRLRLAVAAIDETAHELQIHGVGYCFQGEFVDIIRHDVGMDATL
jgi:MoaA/NifB/PqqE/SkfB family radical SAM enzyme